MKSLLAWAAGIVALCVAGLVVVARVYHPFAGHPQVMHVCGQDYQPGGGTVTREQITTAGVIPFGQITTAPDALFGSTQVWGSVGPVLGAIPRAGDCGATVWLRTGPDAFRPYSVVAH